MSEADNITAINIETGYTNRELFDALRYARNEGQISGLMVTVVVGALALIEITLTRDKTFDKAAIAKYNAWFADHLKSAGISIEKKDDDIIVSQQTRPEHTPDAFNDLLDLEKDLFQYIETTFDMKDRRSTDNIFTRRRDFTEDSKNEQMLRVIDAMANQEDLIFDHENQRFVSDL